jgi:hypothetical protein
MTYIESVLLQLESVKLNKAVRALNMAAFEENYVVESWEEIEESGVCYVYSNY